MFSRGGDDVEFLKKPMYEDWIIYQVNVRAGAMVLEDCCK